MLALPVLETKSKEKIAFDSHTFSNISKYFSLRDFRGHYGLLFASY